MRPAWLLGLSLASLMAGMPSEASAQIFIQPPHVRFRHFFRPRVVFVPPAVTVGVPPPPVYYTTPPPPPPVYVQPYAPPPPVYVQPQCAPCQPVPPVPVAPPPPVTSTLPAPPVYVQPPVMAPPVYAAQPMLPPPVRLPPPRLAQKPQWRHRFGLGARFAGILNTDQIERSSQLGFGGELDFRVARHLALELAGEYQRTVTDGLQRFDVPVTFGMRVHIGPPEWPVSPYFVFATGINYANLDLLHTHDVGWFVLGQAGGGLEIRLGHRVGLSADVRGVARLRMTEATDAVAATTFVNGKPFHPMQNDAGVQFRLGGAVYF